MICVARLIDLLDLRLIDLFDLRLIDLLDLRLIGLLDLLEPSVFICSAKSQDTNIQTRVLPLQSGCARLCGAFICLERSPMLICAALILQRKVSRY